MAEATEAGKELLIIASQSLFPWKNDGGLGLLRTVLFERRAGANAPTMAQ
jgi:hypothetical protein